MELQGRVVKLLPLQEGVSQSTGNPWKRQDFLFGFYESGDSIFEKRIKLDVMNDIAAGRPGGRVPARSRGWRLGAPRAPSAL